MKLIGFGCACAALALMRFGGDSDAAVVLAVIGAILVIGLDLLKD